MTDAHLFAIGVVLAWLAGIRVYLTVFGVGLAGAFGWLDLPQALEVTASPWVIGISGVLAAVEFFADKIPGVDTGWDLLHTLLRVPAGAFLAAATLPVWAPEDDAPAWMREFVEMEPHEVCKEVGITTSNLHVTLYRARLRLRECLENRWFQGKAVA